MNLSLPTGFVHTVGFIKEEHSRKRQRSRSKMKIALDAMGGDFAPRAVVEGALLATSEIESSVILVGNKEEITNELAQLEATGKERIDIVHASQVVEMKETIAKAIRKPNSSIKASAELVRRGEADAFVSMGHSGAVMTIGIVTFGKIIGVDRPALCAVIPTLKGSSVLIDVGANVDSKPVNLVQFAIMGEAFARVVLEREDPKVGLLSNGEEEIKGNEVTKRTHTLLRGCSINYIGYVEGKDLLLGDVDIIVCDGFIGNIILKMGEGFVELLPKFIMKRALGNSEIVGYLPSLEEFEQMIREKFDYNEYGGAPLLGIKGVCIVGHGRSKAKAVKNAILMAEEFVRRDLVTRIERELAADVRLSKNLTN
jgi:glycerol-3-phosphate acyltransferase PlsX